MQSSIIAAVLLLICVNISAQSTFAGTYEGKFNGDNVTLTLELSGNNDVGGNMKDAANRYDIIGKHTGNTLHGVMTESNLGLSFVIDAVLNGNDLVATLSIDVFGTIEKMEIPMSRVESKKSTSSAANPGSAKSRDQRVAGLWVKESNYNSGYGFNDSYGSMSVSESMHFLPDGRMANGNSNVMVGGSNYTGTSSSGEKQQIIDGLYWHTENNKILLTVTQNNQTQTVELGKYYIENNKMLITGSNGEKLLLTRQ